MTRSVLELPGHEFHYTVELCGLDQAIGDGGVISSDLGACKHPVDAPDAETASAAHGDIMVDPEMSVRQIEFEPRQAGRRVADRFGEIRLAGYLRQL